MPFPVGLLLKLICISLAGSAIYKKIKLSPRVPAIHTAPKISRVIDSYEIINAMQGVPIEYWYNETLPDPQYQSSPGCPQSIDGFPWVYNGNPPRCFLVSFGGPCEQGLKITMQSGSLYGVCACQCFVESNEYQLFLPSVSGRYIGCNSETNVTKIFDRESGKCYSKFGQGPCLKGEVITNWNSNSLTCLPKCNHKDQNWRALEKEGLCIMPRVAPFSSTSPIRRVDCPDNQRYSFILRKCTRAIGGANFVG